MKKRNLKNSQFVDNLIINDMTYNSYLEMFKQIVLSMFEWVNLPPSMNAQFLERTLYYNGMATFLKDETYGFINTQCSSNGTVNIYNIPTKLNCYSFDYQKVLRLYTGLENMNSDNECILVQNNWDRTPTAPSIELFAYRLYEAERTLDVNLKAQKTPVMILIDEKQRLLMENLYSQYDGNKPFIFGDKNQLDPNAIKSINTEAPFLCDKIMQYKKAIWNEALTFLRY